MKWIKSFLYNTCIDYVILLCVFIVALVLDFFIKNKYFVLCVGLLVIVSIVFLLKYNINRYKNLRYLTCSHSIIWGKYVWINQYVSRKRDKSKCPLPEFKNDMDEISKVLPPGTVCYCYTHEVILNKIKKKFSNNVEYTEIRKKKLKRLKKQLKSNKCKSCKKTYCPLLKDQIVKYYTVKLTI